ncbi:ankyrin repeat domain-containing protein [Aspergillus puulaauensis]|uniref:Ankyrin repeat-containing domain protein n=1 Tax=Aspergillus puulaauensis TaxID=1220207 RepID=A0A7R7XGE7_9EURO|nr:uncharacterized protein APUU_20591S [Aspergillus puulaauensis]BCS20159.1 hypothetical protein APUU_20591S [Aspergillus puulaauensis]
MTASPVKDFSPGPDEWQHLEDLNQRRRVQNRLSQRNRRTNLRNQNQRRDTTTNTTKKPSEPSKQTRQFFWVPPNTSTVRGELLTKRNTNTNNKSHTNPKSDSISRPSDPDSEIPLGTSWPEIWDSSLHGKSADGGHGGDGEMDGWIDNLMRPLAVMPIEEEMLQCGSPIPGFDATITFDVGDGNPVSVESDSCKVPAPVSTSQCNMQDMDRDRDHFFGYAALHVAASRGHLPIVQLLTERGMPVDQLSSENETALHVAAEKGHFAVARFVLERGAQPHRTNQHGQTALHVAAAHGHCDIVRLLCGYLADLNVVDRNGHTALHRAVEAGHVDVVRVMLERGMDAGVKVGMNQLI